MKQLVRLAKALATLSGWVAGAFLIVTTALIFTEITLRLLAGRSTLVAQEYSGYLLAAMIYGAAGYTLLKGEHIRVGLVYERLSDRGKLWLDRIALALGLFFSTLLVLAFYNLFADSLHYHTKSFTPARTPMVYPHGAVLAGSVTLWLAFFALLIESFLDPRPLGSASE